MPKPRLGIIDQGYHFPSDVAQRLMQKYELLTDSCNCPEAKHVLRETLLQTSDILIHIDVPPLDVREALARRSGHPIFLTMTHADILVDMADWLKENRHVRVCELDSLKDDFGNRRVECLELTGEVGMQFAINKFRKEMTPFQLGKTLRIAILGNGNLARGARKYCFQNVHSVTHLAKIPSFHNLDQFDILVNAINWPMENRGKEYLLSLDELRKWASRPAKVIVDLDVDLPGMGPIPTLRPTTPDNPWYFEEGIHHACVWGWPLLAPIPAGRRYFSQLLPILEDL